MPDHDVTSRPGIWVPLHSSVSRINSPHNLFEEGIPGVYDPFRDVKIPVLNSDIRVEVSGVNLHDPAGLIEVGVVFERIRLEPSGAYMFQREVSPEDRAYLAEHKFIEHAFVR